MLRPSPPYLRVLFAGKHIGEPVDQDACFESVASHEDGFWLKVASFRADHGVGIRRVEVDRSPGFAC